jgi:PAS domain S-box-containing protein
MIHRQVRLRPEDVGIGQLFARIREALVVVDAKTGRIALWNPAAERLFGYSAAEAIGMSVEALIPPELRHRHRAGLARFAATGRGSYIERGEPFEVPSLARDGVPRVIELSLSPLEAVASPGSLYVLALIRDVTARARGVARVRRQADLLDLAPDAIFVCALADNTIQYWSRGAERLYGWSQEEACGSPAHVLLNTELPGDAAEIQAEVLRNGAWEGEVGRTTRDGRRLLVASRWALQPGSSRSGEPAAILIIDTDTTERRRAQEEQQRTSAALSAIIQSAPIAVFAIDLHGNVQLWNPAAERMFGWQAAEVVGGRTSIVPPERRAEVDELRRRVEAGETVTGVVTTRRRRDGSTIDIGLSAAPLRSGGGQAPVEGMMLVLEDVTERKQAADERARLKETELALRERNQVLATVSHDLKAPLTIIKGQAQMLLRQETESQRTIKGLHLIDRAATRMTSWIDELLDTANLQAGRPLALQRAPTDLVALAWQAAAENQRLTEHHRIRVETRQREVIGLWDAPRLARVLDNLLGNAIKYSPDGGDITVSVHLEEDRESAVLSVADRGVGIPEADLPYIFERFRRGANVATRFAGSGIGLAGVSQIVRQHGGTIHATSHPGQGTTFTLTLPLDHAD